MHMDSDAYLPMHVLSVDAYVFMHVSSSDAQVRMHSFSSDAYVQSRCKCSLLMHMLNMWILPVLMYASTQ